MYIAAQKGHKGALRLLLLLLQAQREADFALAVEQECSRLRALRQCTWPGCDTRTSEGTYKGWKHRSGTFICPDCRTIRRQMDILLRAHFVSGTSGTVVEQSAAISAQLADLAAVRGELRRNLLQCNAKRDELSAQLEQPQSENSGLLANVGELETMATDALAMAEANDVELAACNQRIHALEREYKEVSKQMEENRGDSGRKESVARTHIYSY